MSAVIESYKSRVIDQDRFEQYFHVRGVLSEEAAKAALLLTTSKRWNNLWRQDAATHIEPNSSGREGLYDGTITYGPDQPKEPGKVQFSFSTAGGSQKITQSILTRGQFVAEGDTPEDYKQAIGVTDDSIEGAEIETEGLELNYTVYIPLEQLTPAYMKFLRSYTKRWNEHPWKGFDAGEVRLRAVEGEPYDAELAELKFAFVVEENREDVTVGDITGISKQGHDYLWVAYQTVKGEARLKQTPRQVNVEQVYYPADFSDLPLDE